MYSGKLSVIMSQSRFTGTNRCLYFNHLFIQHHIKPPPPSHTHSFSPQVLNTTQGRRGKLSYQKFEHFILLYFLDTYKSVNGEKRYCKQCFELTAVIREPEPYGLIVKTFTYKLFPRFSLPCSQNATWWEVGY